MNPFVALLATYPLYLLINGKLADYMRLVGLIDYQGPTK